MWKILVITAVTVAIAVFAMCFNIIFRKNGRFPDSEISHNKALRKQGIICAKEDEIKLWGKKKGKKAAACSEESGCDSCHSCPTANQQ